MTTLQHVELGVLGPLQVRQYGLPVAIPGAKPRAVLTMLGLHGGSVVSAETLVELLWGDDPPRTAAKALQTHISSLRRALGDGFVLTQGMGWTLSTSDIDASAYKLAAKLAREAFASGDVSQAVTRFDEALTLWRGIPELPDGARGVSEKTRWIEGHAALVEERADALLATGRAAEIIGELEAAIADAPLRERRWGHLMLALYRAGRQGDALGAYQRARSLLAEELGVDPGPDLRRLEAAIVAQDDALEIPVSQQFSSVMRAVTFLLTDIEGSTAAWEADADAMAAALARHDEIVEQVVTSRGGRLIKTRGEGDATFSVFDRPSAAAAASIELQEAIRHEPWALAEPMRIRVALHTGEVELRDGDYFGRAVNRAARLRSLAAGGQILCSGATAELVIDTLADDVVLTDLGMRQLKNLARPEHVFELRLETADDSDTPAIDEPIERPSLPAVLAGPGPFVGRGHELERLLAAYQLTLDGGTGAVLIAGEPGVGKTRLAGEWSRQAFEQGAVVLYGRCDEDLGAPYQPFAEALRSLVPCLGADRVRGLRGVEALLPLVPGLTDALPDLAAPPRADPDTERYALFDAVVALLGIASTSAPVVLILDDLHWAAKPTLLLLRHLLRFGEHARVQILGTYRSTDLDRSHPLAAMLADLHRDGSAHRLQLSGLDEDDVSAYVAEAGYDDEELARALASVTGGNPFFLIEALRHVDESGGRWDPSTLPQGVREAVSRRLSRLPAETNKALATAAVVGSRFELTLVESVVGEDLIDAFDEASKAGIVIEEPGGRYRFNHAIVRQSLLAELASVRRMRLHQRIAVTLETEPADEELLAELAYHYFECAWAGNAAKAVEYCRRAADQAMARLAYEGAADLYDKALHALEEIDDELPDRDDQQAELLVARCEALLAAGDVVSAKGAVSQLQQTASVSARLAAWGTCFDGQLSMLTDPERLDEIESALSAAAEKLAGLEDAAGEAKAHTVRAGCLARLGRIGDAETALDQALTAARRAREHRRVNNVLANAPLAALWGPNPVPRAGGRCLDVIRLLRITTGSPVVEATSTRCQGVLDAFRGRAAAGRALIDSARRTLTELGMRHALLEVDQFAGVVELVADDPAAAEPHLRRAYNGFRRMGLDADTAETAALLARACLVLDRDTEADELCTQSEHLAGHALKASIAWRTVRAELSARRGSHDEARRMAEEAVAVAGRTDLLVDHGDACLTLATVLRTAGDAAGARAAAERAAELYELKGAAALAEKARAILGFEVPTAPVPSETPSVELDNACTRVIDHVVAALNREDWSEVEQLCAIDIEVESRRQFIKFTRDDLFSGEWTQNVRRLSRLPGDVHYRHGVVAVRGERLALIRLELRTADVSHGAPQSEMLQLVGLDQSSRVALLVWFDVEDMGAALAELDAAHARLEERPPRAPVENAASRAGDRLNTLFAEKSWEEIGALFADDIRLDDRRLGLRRESNDRANAMAEVRLIAELGTKNITTDTLAIRGEHLVLSRVRFSGRGRRPDAFHTELLRIVEIAADERIVAVIDLDPDDLDAAFEELDARYVGGEAAPYTQSWQILMDTLGELNRHERGPTLEGLSYVDHRPIPFAPGDYGRAIEDLWELVPDARYRATAVHVLDARGTVVTLGIEGTDSHANELHWARSCSWVFDEARVDVYEEDDLDAALARFDELSRPAQRLENAATKVEERFQACFAARDWAAMGEILADDISADDRRRVVNAGIRHGRDAKVADMRATADLGTKNGTSTVIAIRGQLLALVRIRLSGRDQRPDAFHTEMVGIAEIDADNRMVARVLFDVEDIDAAFEELDTRYLAGEAASHAHTWSVIATAYAGFNRREFSATTAEWEDVDHRRGAAFAPGEMRAYLQAAWDDSPDTKIYIAAVHRLSDLGGVVTHVAHGISQDGFDAEWRDIHILTVEGETLSRSELFDESDIDAALATFDGLSRPAPRLENAASQVWERLNAYFSSGDWAAMSQAVAQNMIDDDRRRTVNGGIRRGKDIQIANGQAVAETGADKMTSTVIAIRGERLALCRSSFFVRDQQPGTFRIEFLSVIEIDVDEQVAAHVGFDLDDIDAAFEELDARYLAGEAAAYRNTWSVIAQAYASINRHEPPPLTPDCVNIDHRRTAVAIAPGDLIAYILSGRELGEVVRPRMEVVHRLTNRGAVITYAANGTSPTGFEAEWREISLSVVDGDLINRVEIFDESDIDAALAKFEQLTGRGLRLESTASQVAERYWTHFADRNWDALAEILTDEFWSDDRRRMVGAGVRHGRNAEIEDLRAISNLGLTNVTSTIIATRGERLILGRVLFSGPDHRPESALTEILGVIEIAADQRIRATIVFDPDDLDAAFEELDARYLAGEAAPYSHTWSVVAEASAAVNRHEIPPTTPRWVNIDHRRGTAFAPGDAIANIRAWWDLTPEAKAYIEAVHRLSNLGAVISYSASGTSQEGFDAEWRLIELLTVDGDLINRCEIFDETDLDAAVARFDELSSSTPRLENAASQAYERFKACFAARDWEVLAEILADDVYSEDRRRVVNAGQQQGRDAVIAELSGLVEVVTTVTSEAIASRGARLVLSRARAEGYEAFLTDVLDVIEVDTDGLVVRRVVFDPDDFDAAIAELDARYLAGEAAAHAHTWSVIARGLAAFNRRELPGFTPDSVNIDHRLARGFAPGDLTAYIGATWDLAPDVSAHAEAVHRLSNLAAVWTHAVRGTSQDGFDAEWREICLATVEGDLINRIEMFDEQDIDAALTKFEQLTQSVPTLENAASQVAERLLDRFAVRDWNAITEIFADDFFGEDRRPVVGAGIRYDRDVEIASIRAGADLGGTNMTSPVIATRGDRLILTRTRHWGRDQAPDAFRIDVLAVVEIDADERIVTRIVFDPDNFEAALAELDARYLAGEAAANAHTWSLVAGTYAATNRHELPPTTPDWVNIDHRRLTAFAPGDMAPYIRATWDVAPDIRIFIEAVHRLSDLGAVVTHVVRGSSQEGFEAEWREIVTMTVAGDRFNRSELFDEADLDDALARFDELSRPALQLENAASRVDDRFEIAFAARDFDVMAGMLTDEVCIDDRRRVVNAGVRCGRDVEIASMRATADLGVREVTSSTIATRGERLALSRNRFVGRDQRPEAFHSEALCIIEIDTDERILARVTFDPDQNDAAIAELDVRYLAGGAAAHAHTWSVVARGFDAVNRREIPATTPDFADIDHRQVAGIGSGDLRAYLSAAFDDLVDNHLYVESVHRLTDLGAVVTHVAKGTSLDGLDVEWRLIDAVTIDGDLINRYEMFDETDLDAALARFDELSRPAPRLGNAASELAERFRAHFVARDWDAMAEILTDDIVHDDRRRVVGAGVRHGRDAEIENMRTAADLGSRNMESTIIATRGERLALLRLRFSDEDQAAEALLLEVLGIVEVNADNRIATHVAFDPNDTDTAFEELDTRYLAGEAAPHAHTWSLIARSSAAFNRHVMAPATPDWVNIDHRRGTAFAPGELVAYVRAGWELHQNIRTHIEAVHRLSGIGAVYSWAGHGTSQEGFEAEWRGINVVTFEGDLINRSEMFDEVDLDAALAKFDDLNLSAPALESAASRVYARLQTYFASRNWVAMTEVLADDISADDRRRVVGAGLRHGRDAEMALFRAMAETGATNITSVAIAARGTRLALCRTRVTTSGPEAFDVEALQVAEIDADERITALVSLDLEDIDAAFEELDARYLAGEAAAHSRTWSVIAGAYAALNRHELPATTPGWVNIDRQRLALIEQGDMFAHVRAAWEALPDWHIRVVAVYRLTALGAVATWAATGTSRDGFEAENQGTAVLTVDGDLITGFEMFDAEAVDAALARFDELSRSTRQLENAASRVDDRFEIAFAARDFEAMAELIADDIAVDDRRRPVNAGLRRGRHVEIANMRAMIDLGVREVTSSVIAARGDRLALSRNRFMGRDHRPEAFRSEVLCIIEIDTDERIAARISFGDDDSEAAFAELDARYAAGEAAAHEHTWSLIARNYAAFNRHEFPSAAPGWMTIDHRRGISFEPGELTAYIHSTWDTAPDTSTYIETVHRVSDLGAVFTQVSKGSSQQGFEAEWREICLLTADGETFSGCELFDEADIQAALARFDELSRPVPRPENAASEVGERFLAHFAARDWDALANTMSDDFTHDDRRRVVGSGLRLGRDATSTDLRAVAELWLAPVRSTVIATRGERLYLMNVRFTVHAQGPDAFLTEVLAIGEANSDNRLTAGVVFDPDDIDAAFTELDARYVAGEAAAHAHTWLVIAGAYSALNRHELPATTPNWVTIDHQQVTKMAPGDFIANIRASWDLTPDLTVYIEAVHRLSNLGAVVSYSATGTSQEGFDAEWRLVEILTLEGDLFNRCEIFDEADLDAALARFDELDRPTPRLENAASQLTERFCADFAARDWTAMDGILAQHISVDDRRRVVGAGVRHGQEAEIENLRAWADIGIETFMQDVVAIRGRRLALCRARWSGPNQHFQAFQSEALGVVEINADNQIAARVMLDVDDIDAAFEELDARYLAGEGAEHSHTWSLIARTCAAFNQHVMPPTTPDWVNIDHRKVTAFAPGDMTPYMRVTFDVAPDIKFYIEAVHRLTTLGAVFTQRGRGISHGGFEGEWRDIILMSIEGDQFNRCEVFDETDLDAALARFDELGQQVSPLENAATRTRARMTEAFNGRDVDAFLAMADPNGRYDDRRRGLRDAGVARRQVVQGVFEAPKGWRSEIEPIAIRGNRLGLTRERYRDTEKADRPVTAETITLTEVDDDELVCYTVHFDPDDINGATRELTARWIASGEVAHQEVIEAALRVNEIVNRHDWETFAALSEGATFVNHRQLSSPGVETIAGHMASVRATAVLVPDYWVELAEVIGLSASGVLVRSVLKGTSAEGFAIELPIIALLLFDRDRISHFENFDPDQRHMALARFDELNNSS